MYPSKKGHLINVDFAKKKKKNVSSFLKEIDKLWAICYGKEIFFYLKTCRHLNAYSPIDTKSKLKKISPILALCLSRMMPVMRGTIPVPMVARTRCLPKSALCSLMMASVVASCESNDKEYYLLFLFYHWMENITH